MESEYTLVIDLKLYCFKWSATYAQYLLYSSHAFTYLPLKSGTTIWSSCSAKVDVIPRTNPSISGPTVSCMKLFKINYIL